MILENGATILFQGDSITDCGRKRDENASLGGGYPALVAAMLSARYPRCDFTVVNKGISGNRVKDLTARWQEDCIDIKPDVLSILIGINDTWRRYDRDDPTTAEQYEAGYREILSRATAENACQLIIIEPFLLAVPDKLHWHEDLDPKIQAARKVAREFGALYIPMDGIFAAASMAKAPAFWAADGVHPTAAGHMLIAEKWMELVIS